ncbi:hypothetical protein J1N35_020819 [Gossypium stocksii]|uniref:Uncharacterized protein n=1 Tax=Gossypium stocksii TaxID=47602 RepID=A0A9D3VDH7_9ROSI|nr:hypothetical protein J1N35_020819 [Gossypium stocksii]
MKSESIYEEDTCLMRLCKRLYSQRFSLSNEISQCWWRSSWEKRIDNFTLREGVVPASFKVLYDSHRQKETLVADFRGSAMRRVAPVDSWFWVDYTAKIIYQVHT